MTAQDKQVSNVAPEPEKRLNRGTLNCLTGLRFFAAIYVVLFHYIVEVRNYREVIPASILTFLGGGQVSVCVFFALSGFVLTYSYVDDSGKLTVGLKSFFVSRLARLYPAYILAFVMFLPTMIVKYWHPGSKELMWCAPLSLSAVQAWTPWATVWNQPAWSLSAEAFFYLVFPIVAPAVTKYSQTRPLQAILLLWLSSLIWPCLFVFGESEKLYSAALWDSWLNFIPLFWLPSFLMGIVIGKQFLLHQCSPLKTIRIPSYVSICILALLIALSPKAWNPILSMGLTLPLICALLFWLPQEDSRLSRALGTRYLVTLGEASYGTYVFQHPVWNLTVPVLNSIALGASGAGVSIIRKGLTLKQASSWTIFATYLLVLVAFSIASFRIFENPLNRLIKKKLLSQPTPPNYARVD